MTILEAARALRAKKVSSAELTAQSLDRICRLNPKLNAFLTVMEEHARARARQADDELARGIDRGPLHGIPVAVKDLFCTRGVRTTAGSKLFADYVPDFDAAVVDRLEAAGAVIVGKTAMHELAFGITSNNPHFGAVHNPYDLARIPGGSSGGSGAAVASGMVFMAMGSDTGGSIRIPASYCGTVGLKPTYGRVSRYGALPLGYSLDHMGPLARTVRDAAITLEAIAGFDARDEASSREPVPSYQPGEDPSLAGVRIGVPENYYFDRVDPEVAAAVLRMVAAAEARGARAVSVRAPDMDALNTVSRIILHSEAAAYLEPWRDRRSDVSPEVLALFDQGRLLRAVDYVNAQRLRKKLLEEFRAVWKQADCLFTPATPIAAPRIDQRKVEIAGEKEDVRLATTRFARGINALGWPALAMPCGMSSEGLPLGMQMIGRPFDEAFLLRAGAAIEMAIPAPAPALAES